MARGVPVRPRVALPSVLAAHGVHLPIACPLVLRRRPVARPRTVAHALDLLSVLLRLRRGSGVRRVHNRLLLGRGLCDLLGLLSLGRRLRLGLRLGLSLGLRLGLSLGLRLGLSLGLSLNLGRGLGLGLNLGRGFRLGLSLGRDLGLSRRLRLGIAGVGCRRVARQRSW